jgi:hypothetical protein
MKKTILLMLLLITTAVYAAEVKIDGYSYNKTNVMEFNAMPAPAVSPAGKGRIYYDVTGNVLKKSENGGAYEELGSGASADDTAYDASTWNGSLLAPTQNAVRDKIETISVSGGGTAVNTTPTPDVVSPADTSHDFAVGGTDSTAGVFLDASAKTGKFEGGITVGRDVDENICITFDPNTGGTATLCWINGVLTSSVPIDAGGAGPSYTSEGLTVNDDSTGTDDSDFIVETDLEDQFLKTDASAEVFRIGDFDTNYVQWTTAGVMTFAGTGDIDLPANSVDEVDLKAVDSASDEECLTYETTTGDFEWQACGTSTKPPKEFVFPASATLPLEAADSIPPIARDAGTNFDQLVVDFDASTDECRQVNFEAPTDIDTAGTVTFRVKWYSAAATTGDAYWDFRHNSGVADGADPDQAPTTEADAGDTVAGTAGQISVATWTETVSNLGWAANDQVDGTFCRDANNASDNLAGDARVTQFVISIPRS